MGFFEPPAQPPEPLPPVSLPEWAGPPANVIGALVPLGLMAARSEDAAVWLESATVYPTGVQFRIDVRWRAEVPGAGAGGDRRWSQDLWLWPLPPEGHLDFVCEWPALGIALTRAELDSDQMRRVAHRVETLWQNDHGPSPPRPTASLPF